MSTGRKSRLGWVWALLLLGGAASQRRRKQEVGSAGWARQPEARTGVLSRPGLQGVGAIATVIGVLVGVLVWRLDIARDVRESTANIYVEQVFHRDEPGRWHSQVVIGNKGPGTPKFVRTVASSLTALCARFTVGPDPVTGQPHISDFKTERAGSCAIGLVSTRSLSQKDLLPGIFAREPDEEVMNSEMAVYSASIRDLLPGELLWIERTFEVSSRDDVQLASIGPTRLESILGTFGVEGDKVRVKRLPSRFLDHTAAS